MALKTDYKADVFEGNRKYQISTDVQGKSEIVDVTTYSQEGDLFKPEDINATNAAVNRANGKKDITLTAAAWTGSAAPYTQVVTVAGITVEDIPSVGIIYPTNCTRAQQKAINKAVSYIYDVETGAGKITVRATQKPAVDITLGLKGVV